MMMRLVVADVVLTAMRMRVLMVVVVVVISVVVAAKVVERILGPKQKRVQRLLALRSHQLRPLVIDCL